MKKISSQSKSAYLLNAFRWMCVLSIVVALSGLRAQAQEASFTQNSGGSNVMGFEVPLADYPGRGIGLPVTLRYSTGGLWRVGFLNTVPLGQNVRRSVTEAIYAEHSTAGWTTSLDVPKIEWPRQNDIYWYTGKPYSQGTVSPYTFRIARVYIHMPDGSIHEMRKGDAVYQDNGTIDQFGIFYAVDGSRMRFDANGASSGTLFLADGTRYIIGTTSTQYIDRNGNTLNYDATNRRWTDTLGRVISMPWPANPGPGDYTYTLPGVGTSSLVYTLKFRSLSSALTPGSSALRPMADYYLPDPNSPPTGQAFGNFPQVTQQAALFTSGYADPEETTQSYTYVVGHGQSFSSLFDPTVLAEIVFPNGLSYKFSYNNFGEMDKVIAPTGAYQRFQYDLVPSLSAPDFPYHEGSRGLRSRWISANGTGGTDEAQWQYSAGINPFTVTAPDGTRTETYVFSTGAPSNNFGYIDARQGMVTETRIFAPGVGGAMLRRTLNDYAITTSINNKPVPPNTNNSGTYTAYRNPRLVKTVTLLLDTLTSNALSKTTTYEWPTNGFDFQTGLDQTATNDYFFADVDQTTAQSGAITSIPLGTLASRGEVTYLNNSLYRSRNILGLPTSALIKDGSLQIISRADSFYDEVGYPLLTYGDLTGSDYIDPGTTARGNVTTARVYTDIGLGLFLDTHAQFDQCGNLRNNWNERNIQSTVDFSSTYKHAFPTTSSTAPPDPSGQHGSIVALTTSGTFDYNTGKTLTSTDVNGQVTTYSFQDDQGNYDVLGRLRKIIGPDGSWTKYSFGETLGNIYVMTEVQMDATRSLKTYQYTDPLGRNSRSFASEDGTNYLATDTLYDQMGREWKVSNAYRTTTRDGVADLAHTTNWTVKAFDPLSRTITATLPDGAVTHVDYQGNYTTVTDESGMQRRQKIDSFGRVIRIDEPDTTGSLGPVDGPTQATYYDYNARGNLVHIKQGLVGQTLQHRYFKYDAMGRLTYERQVEQAGTFSLLDPVTGNSSWSRKLVYDETINSMPYPGLLTTAWDARNVSTQFRYDQVNRVYQVNYSDGTPTVNNNYDQARTGYFNKGKLTQALTAAVGSVPATAQLYNFDLMGRIANQQQTVGAQSYSMSYGYNLGGALASETYPSGRVVNYGYDNGGRLSGVSSGATTYASNYDYTSATGLLKAFTSGNGTVTSMVYNSRLQIQSLDLALGGTQIQHYDYKYGAYDPVTNSVDQSKNAGQIAEIEGFIGTQKQWQQRFAYDKVGRLSLAREFRGDNSQQSYLVNYEYDVFGNRYQKQAQNGGNPFSQVWVESNHIDQATNRFSSGVTYDNAGNITVDSKFRNLQFQYDANNRQKQSANADGSGAVVSVYDAGGQRVGTQVGGSLTNVLVYDAQGKLLVEYSSTTGQGGTQYIFKDHQGSPRVITGNAGQVIARHDYLAFGEELGLVGMRASTPGYGGVDSARQKYAGMERNEVTNLSHTLWREYDSLSGRWTSPDPYGKSMMVANPQSFNRYAYVQNDPVNRTDPAGLLPGAETSWSDVADGFWGQSIPFFQYHFGGPAVIGERLMQIDSGLATSIAKLKNRTMNHASPFLDGDDDDGIDVIVTDVFAFPTIQEAIAYYNSYFAKFRYYGSQLRYYSKRFVRHTILGGIYAAEGVSRIQADGIQLGGSALWVFSGSVTVTNDLHVFVGVDTPNVADLLKFGLAGKIISKPTQVLSGSVTAVKILGMPTTQQRDGFFGGTNFNVAGGAGPYGGVSVSPDGTTAIMGGYGEGINIGASFSPGEPTFKIPHPTFEQMKSFVRRTLRD